MKKFGKIINLTVISLYCLVFSALLLDSYKNPKKFEHFALFDPAWLLLLVLVINLLIRLNKMTTLSSFFINLNKFFLFPVFSLATIFLSVWGYLSPPNFVYSKFPFNPLPLLLIGAGSGLLGLINAKTSFLKINAKILIFLAPLIFIFVGTIMWLWPNDFFITLNKEDHFIENTQFLFLVIAFILAFAISYRFFKSKNEVGKRMGIVYLLVGLGLFIIAGEEISWGQRIFGIVTPEFIANQNSQGEINIHNLGFFSKFTNLTYLIIGLYGSLSWILNKFRAFKNFKFSRYFAVPWYFSLYFLPIFIYDLLLPPTKPHGLGEWSEMTELSLYGGFLGFMLTLWFI